MPRFCKGRARRLAAIQLNPMLQPGKGRGRVVHEGKQPQVLLVDDVVPDERILWASKMTFGDTAISAALMTAEMLPVAAGAELSLTFQGAFFEGADGPQIREMGWLALLDRLAGVLG